ncbi:hypothetical protein SBRCBS47491_006620 [Sporothrix bragantina]|uniref:C6 finger domain protein n=1 Tax=Sporothrix bragantina TaxID=671064 RepID=A0ABP0C6F7_9PEZI
MYNAPPGRLKRALRAVSASSPASVASPVLGTSQTSPASLVSPTSPAGEDVDIIRYYKEQYLSFLMTKSPEWSFVSGIVYLGRTNSAVMSLIMANVQFQAAHTLQPHPSAPRRLQALQHYQSGLQDFSALVASGEYEPLTLLSALFLLVQFELRHADNVDGIQSHLRAFGAVLTLVPGLCGETNLEYRNVLNRLGLWLTYMDAVAAAWDLGGGVIHTVLDSFGPHALDRVFAESREAGQEIWGASYPTAEALDDLQNRPAFDLYHAAHILRYHVACYRFAAQGGQEDNDALRKRIEDTICKIYQVREVY